MFQCFFCETSHMTWHFFSHQNFSILMVQKTFLGVITLLIIVLNRFYATNMYTTLKTTIYLQSNLRNSGLLLLLLFEFHNFSFLIDKIDNIIYTSHQLTELPPMAVQCTGHVIQTETCDNNAVLPLVGVLVMWYGSIDKLINYIY